MTDDEDPEVIADLQLRARTERDPTRMKEPPTYSPAVILGVVPCRGRCGAVVDWPEEAELAFATWNSILERRDEPPLDKTKIVFCEECKKLGKSLTAEANRKNVDLLATKIRALKASPNPRNEHDLIRQIAKLNHPDVKGLLDALQAKLDKSTGRKAPV